MMRDGSRAGLVSRWELGGRVTLFLLSLHFLKKKEVKKSEGC